MYKILLADDEGIVLEALTFIIQKNFPDTFIIETAKTGRNVIELAERFRPDIAFMDIQMPGINGIEAMKEIRATNPNTIFIILSAHDKFDYAKEAINIGVLEYINKPMEQTEIITIIKKALVNIEKERQKRSNDLLVKEKLEIVIPIIENSLIYSLVLQEDKSELDNFKRLLGIIQKQGYIMVIEYGDVKEAGKLTNTLGTSVRIQNQYKDMSEIIKQYFGAMVGPMMANYVLAYVPMESEQEEYLQRIEIIEKTRKMVRELAKKLDAVFRVGVGMIHNMEEMAESYREGMDALHYAESSVSHAGDLPIRCGYEEDYPIHIEKELFEAVTNGDVVKTLSTGDYFFEWMVNHYDTFPMDIKLKSMEFVLAAEKIAYVSGGMTYHFRSRSDYFKTVYEVQSYEDLKSWFITKLQDAAINVSRKKEETYIDTISKAKEYIKIHFSRDLSLDDVSKEFNISPYYFSKLFKKETGDNFIDYITSVRIEKAKELLISSDNSMKEICIEVGYQDPNYFSRTFKKNVGVTPTDYRENKV